ncbi:MAG: HAD-IA family hydrolase [Spirochaetales bacterium]|nr:HAD-IA family hydrolase [Spirochaetales bacterium]
MNDNSPLTIKAVVFDLFSTLTSLTQLPEAPGRNSHEILGVDRTDWLEAVFHQSRERLVGEIKEPVEIIRDIAWKIDPTLSEELLEETARERRIRFRYCLENPPAGVVDSVRKIKEAGFKLALVSNADAVEIEGWEGSELGSLFDETLFSCHEGYMKPEKEIFQICLNRLGLSGPECLYVGDGGNEELIASAREGMHAVLTTQFLVTSWPEKIAERKKTVNYHIDNLNQVLPLIERLHQNG